MAKSNGQDDLLLRLLDFAGEHAHKVLLEQKLPSLIPVYLLYVREGKSIIVGCPWHDEAEKDTVLAMVKLKAHEIGATAVSFVAEAWALMATPEQALDLDRVLPVRENPKRIEVVNAMATDGMRTVARSWQMLRDKPGGRLLQLVRMPDTDSAVGGVSFSGRMIDGFIRRR